MKPYILPLIILGLILILPGCDGCSTTSHSHAKVHINGPCDTQVQTLLADQAQLDSLNLDLSIQLASALAEIDTLREDSLQKEQDMTYLMEQLRRLGWKPGPPIRLPDPPQDIDPN